jgi:predicted amidohydrolase
MAVLLQGGRVVDPASGVDAIADVLCVDERPVVPGEGRFFRAQPASLVSDE